jgi:SAM-dependent methyltransferase
MDEAYRQAYYDLERTHWWFRAREAILKSYLTHHIKLNISENPQILNLGAATGRSSQMLETFGKVTSVEPDESDCKFLSQELGLKAYFASATSLPFQAKSFDLVCAFDVIEHIGNDEAALQEIQRVLKPGGQVLITVPAFPFLWSRHDEVNQHYRRYTKKQLLALTAPSLSAVYYSYFNFFLFPAIFAYRIFSKLSPWKIWDSMPKSDFSVPNPSFSEKLFFYLFRFERYLLSRKVMLPMGVSLIFEGQKMPS